MQYFGRAKVYYNGKLLDTLPGAKLNVGGIERKEVVNEYTIGYAEMHKPAMVECEIPYSLATNLDEIKNIAGATIQFSTDNGHTWIVNNAFLREPPMFSGGDGGKIPLKFTGNPAEHH